MTIEETNEILTKGDGLVTFDVVRLKDLLGAADKFKLLNKVAIILLLKKGTAEIEIDYKLRKLDAYDQNLLIVSEFSRIGKVLFSNDIIFSGLVISRRFVSRLIPPRSEGYSPFSTMTIPIANMFAIRDNPTIHLLPTEKNMISKLLEKVKTNSSRTTAVLRVQLLYVSAVELIMELMNIVIPKYRIEKDTDDVERDRKRYIIEEFSRILFENFKKEHSVQFYADRLCISAQYLSKVTKSALGISASKVISNMIFSESLVMLRMPKMSMQQIASELGFSDQSSFGKFFRKMQGISPLNYRKEI